MNDLIAISPQDQIYVSYETSGYNPDTSSSWSHRETQLFDADRLLYINDITHLLPGEVVHRILNYFRRDEEISNVCIFNWWIFRNNS